MTEATSTFRYVTYIRSTPDAVFAAITRPGNGGPAATPFCHPSLKASFARSP